jgi:hypothetical protein
MAADGYNLKKIRVQSGKPLPDTDMDTLYDTDVKSLAHAAYARFRDAFMRHSEYNDKRVVVGFSGGTSLSDFYEVFVEEF